jgi:uncharacterized protein with FMN-binding domain
MRRIILWLLSTVSVVALLFGYSTSTSGPAPVASETVVAAPPVPTAAAAPQATSPATGTGSAPSTTPATSGATTVTGSVAQTRWGPVQVQLTVDNGRITAVTVLQYPNGNGKDEQINARALPILTRATLTAQSANIDMVSGATVTSTGYVQSLQSALDQAHLA